MQQNARHEIRHLILPLWLNVLVVSVAVFSSPQIVSAGKQTKAESPKKYLCYRAKGPIKIDGKLDEPAWRAVRWTDDFVDIEGDAKPRPRFRTRAKMLWDDEYFYVGAELQEPHVWATLTKRDSVIFHDNDFEVFIDPDGDNHEYYELEINALSTVWDLLLKRPYRDGGPAVNEWDIAGLRTAVQVNGTLNDPTGRDKGWSVEVALPWTSLAEYAHKPTPPRDGDQWRVNFSRVQWRHEITDSKYRKMAGQREDNWVWSPQGAVDMHRPERWGSVQFSTAKVGNAVYHPDPAAPARDVLHRIYYAQRGYQKQHGRWAATLAQLGLADLRDEALSKPPVIELTSDGFQAVVEIGLPDGKIERWHIRQDSRVWLK